MKLGTQVIAIIAGNIRLGVVTALSTRLHASKEKTQYTVSFLDINGAEDDAKIEENDMHEIRDDNHASQIAFIHSHANAGWVRDRALRANLPEEEIPF
jgi:hypothetical protein